MGTGNDQSTHSRYLNHVKDSPPFVDIQITEYPVPLNIGGRLEYHVVINDKLVNMPDEVASKLIDMYKIKPIPKEEFHKMQTGRHGIWASTPSQASTRNGMDQIAELF